MFQLLAQAFAKNQGMCERIIKWANDIVHGEAKRPQGMTQ